jgi:chemotaxis protein methyltransferase CheR
MTQVFNVFSEAFEEQLKELLEVLYSNYKYDFRDYAMASLRRRLNAAMSRFGWASPAVVKEKVIADPQAFHNLLQYLVIPTSEMFRDPSYYAVLREKVIPFLKTFPYLKFWIAGCSTGEEVFSLAIILKEEGLLEKSTIYATDINPLNLKKAKAGIFPSESVRIFSRNYHLSGGRASFVDYYTSRYGAAVFDENLLKNVVFADHSLATDSVFSEVQLISCRNVLIYFNRTLQDRAIGLFCDSLCYQGFLALGSKETLTFSKYVDKFSAFAREERVYQKMSSGGCHVSR